MDHEARHLRVANEDRPLDFALNQKTASRLDFPAFLNLAADLGCVGVEARNDLGRPLFDGIAPGRAAEMARSRGLRLIGLSEVYPFDDWNAERRAAVAALIEAAEAAGAETISLIPRVDVRDPDPKARGGSPRRRSGDRVEARRQSHHRPARADRVFELLDEVPARGRVSD